jgi:uncharacterized membrane protein (DUF106 family)
MRFQALMVLLLIAAGAAFAFLNPAVITRVEVVNTPLGEYQAPLVDVLLIAAAAALLTMLASSAFGSWKAAAHQRTLDARLDQYQRELAELKSRAYDEVSRKVEVLQQELSHQLEDFRKALKKPAVALEDGQVEKAEMVRMR